MKKLSMEKAMQQHRDMWTWIAEKTRERREVVRKEAYFAEHNWFKTDIPMSRCFCCEYAMQKGKFMEEDQPCDCILIWGNRGNCTDNGSIYMAWMRSSYWQHAAMLAEEIAKLQPKE